MKVVEVIRNKFKKKGKPVDNLFIHTVFNYMDKAVNLLSPILVIRILHNQLLYNKIEYVLSSSIILSVLVDFGLSSYYFYGYRQSEDKKEFIHSIERCFLLLFTLQAIFVFGSVGMYFILRTPALIVYTCILIRTLFLSYTNFKFNTYRAIDQPSKIFYITIPVNLISFALFYMAYMHFSKLVIYYFIGLAGFELIYIVYSFTKYSDLRIKQFWPLLKTSILFAWPLMINVFLLNVIINYGKIYAYKHFTPDEMTTLALMQRFMFILQLSHTAAASFFLKKIFEKKSITLDYKVLKSYSSSMVTSVILIAGCIYINNAFHVTKSLPFNSTFWLLVIFFLFYCYGAYFSTYFTLLNRNNTRMVISMVTVAIYMACMYILKPGNLTQLIWLMMVTMGLNLAYALYFLYKNNVLKYSLV